MKRYDMSTALINDGIIQRYLGLSSDIMKLPIEHMWIDYDKEADVLYLSFRKPQRAKDTVELDDDILVRKDGNRIVGVTIMDAGNR